MPQDTDRGRTEPPTKRALAAQLVTDIVHGASEDARQTKQAARPPRRRSRLALWLALLGVLVAVTAWNSLRPREAPVVFTPTEEAASLRWKVFLAAQAIDGFHRATSTYPATLAAAGVDDSGWTYAPAGSTYVIVGRLGSLSVEYHQGDPLAPLAAGLNTLTKRAPR